MNNTAVLISSIRDPSFGSAIIPTYAVVETIKVLWGRKDNFATET